MLILVRAGCPSRSRSRWTLLGHFLDTSGQPVIRGDSPKLSSTGPLWGEFSDRGAGYGMWSTEKSRPRGPVLAVVGPLGGPSVGGARPPRRRHGGCWRARTPWCSGSSSPAIWRQQFQSAGSRSSQSWCSISSTSATGRGSAEGLSRGVHEVRARPLKQDTVSCIYTLGLRWSPHPPLRGLYRVWGDRRSEVQISPARQQ